MNVGEAFALVTCDVNKSVIYVSFELYLLMLLYYSTLNL